MEINRRLAKILWIAFVLSSAGCASVNEIHHFGSFEEASLANPTGLVNVFRLKVDANSGLSSLRCVSGEYDDRAVEFFLNESRAADYSPGSGVQSGIPKIFNLNCLGGDDTQFSHEDCVAKKERTLSIGSLATGVQEPGRSFVMIMSTDASAISDTIGSIADNQIMIQSLNYLMNKDNL